MENFEAKFGQPPSEEENKTDISESEQREETPPKKEEEVFDSSIPENTEETELSVETKKETQSKIIKDWAEGQGFEEGNGFKIISSFADNVEKNDITAPHELGNLYLAFKKDHFQKFTDFFDKEYPNEMNKKDMQKSWSSKVNLNYSWGGRYCVSGEGGVAIDSAPVESIDPLLCKPEHGRFKEFFKEKYGFELPSAEKLDEIMMEMSDSLPWYENSLQELKKEKEKSTEPWKYEHPINQLEYANIILKDAKTLKQSKENLKKVEELGGKEAVEKVRETIVGRYKLKELPEEFSYIEAKIRHYNDLTYNADDWIDLENVKELLGEKCELPKDKGSRIDRIYEDNYNFDRKNFEVACREFSGIRFPSKTEK